MTVGEVSVMEVVVALELIAAQSLGGRFLRLQHWCPAGHFAFYEPLQGLRRAVRGIRNLSADLNQSVPCCGVVERPGQRIDQLRLDRFR